MDDIHPPVATDKATLKVIDVGAMVGGPFVATLLGDLGAEVIKVEPPRTGEFLRYVGGGDGYSLLWQVHGRNKRSVTLDLKQSRGQEILRRLAAWADIIVENLRPGVMERWHLDYESLSVVNPRLVYVSVSGFGQTGPYRQRPGYEWVGAAMSGLTYLTGFTDRPPVMPGIAITDHTSALFATIGALEAVRRRDAAGSEGRGTHVDVGLYEPPIRMANAFLTDYAVNGIVQEREGSIPSGQPGQHSRLGYVYETSDGRYLATYTATRAQFDRLVAAIGRPELSDDPRFASDADRMTTNYGDVDAILREWVSARPLDEALRVLVEADQAVAPVYGPEEIFADPHIRARENLVTVENARGQPVPIPNVLPHLSDDPGGVRWPAELLGASNVDVYQGLLGFTDDELAQLERDEVI